MKNKIVLVVLSIFLIFLIACQQTVKKETKPATTTTPTTGAAGDSAVDAVGKDLNNTDTVANDLSTDTLGNLDSGLSDVQNI